MAATEDPRTSTDADLAGLPPPRRRFRTVTFVVMGLTALFALRLALGLRGELVYTLRGGAPTDLGELGQRSPAGLTPNSWVRAEGALSENEVVRYSRPLENDSYRLALSPTIRRFGSSFGSLATPTRRTSLPRARSLEGSCRHAALGSATARWKRPLALPGTACPMTLGS